MTDGNVTRPREHPAREAHATDTYDPFVRGRFPVGVRTIQGLDSGRDRRFPCEVWYPAATQHAGQDLDPGTMDSFAIPSGNTRRRQTAVRDATARPGAYPLIVFSHSSGSNRLQSTFLCTHLSSWGYLVAALDHSEVVAAELLRKEGESDEQRAVRIRAWIESRVPDIRFLLDHLLDDAAWDSEARIDPTRIGIVGHSFGGWTALAAPEVEGRIRSVVALAPGGSSRPKPGIIPGTLTFAWGREVPTLYLVAEDDVFLPLAGMDELFARTPATRRMFILRRADHLHFVDDVEEVHETVRSMPLSGDAAALREAMRPMAELCSGEQAHLFVRGLTLCHMDATLREQEDAHRFMAGDMEAELAARGIDVIAHQP